MDSEPDSCVLAAVICTLAVTTDLAFHLVGRRQQNREVVW